MVELLLLGGLVALLLAGLLVHLLRVEEHGLTDQQYEEAKRSGGRLGSALLAIQALFEPAKRHEVEVRRAEEAEDAESGAPALPETC